MTRWVSARALPQHAFVPGVGARASCHAPPPRARVEPQLWRDDVDYLHGVDLWNARYLWEAHEAWEGPWRAARGRETQATFLRGLIQCAAAALHVPMGKPAGLARLCARGTQRLEALTRVGFDPFMGLSIAPFVADFRGFAASRPTTLDRLPPLELG